MEHHESDRVNDQHDSRYLPGVAVLPGTGAFAPAARVPEYESGRIEAARSTEYPVFCSAVTDTSGENPMSTRRPMSSTSALVRRPVRAAASAPGFLPPR